MSGMDRGLVLLARSMLDQLHIAMDIRSVDDLNSLVFALIYEGLCGEHIPDLVRNPRSAEDEVHNCQLVIDALSMDILHTSLSHITGEDLATGDRLAMSNLLEIFSGLMEYILNKIDSDISSTDDDAGADIEDDPDAMTPDEIDDILERELRRPPQQYRETGRSGGPSLSGRSSRPLAPASWDDQDGKLESTASLIREGEMLERQGLNAERGLRPSSESQAKTGDGRRGQQRDHTPPLRDHPVSRLVTLPSQLPGLADTAQDVTPELSPPKRQATAHAFDNIGVRISRPETSASVGVDGHPGNKVKHLLTEAQPSTDTDRTHRTYTHHLYHHYSQPAPVAGPANITNRSAAPVSATVVSEVQQNRSFDRLKAEVDRTVQMSRDAVSPDRGRAQADQPKSTTSRSKSPSLPVSAIAPPSSDSGAGRDTTKAVSSLVKEEQLLSANMRERLSRIESESTEIHQLAASLNLPARAQPDVAPFSRSAGPSAQPDNDPQGLAARKVCFRVEPETVQQADKPAPVDQRRRYPPAKAAVSGRGGRTRGGKKPVRTRLAGKTVPVARRGYSSDGDVDDGCDLLSSPETSPERYKQRYRALLLEDLEARARRRPGLKPHTAVTNPLRRKAVDPLRETQIHINAEDNKARQKTQYLRLLYEQELEDLKDELKQQKKEEKTNTESEYKKKVLNSKKPKSTIGKLSGVRGGRSRQVAGHSIKPKARRRSASASPSVGRRVPSSTAGEEGNLFGLLYEEFPYLYLSPDTWHELWRQGIQQIERITHSQQAARTRKNRGIAQLEEAESRQKILLGIMRKELAHNQRMREQKVKKQQELSVKNKLHEKRMQSARSRKYYNEYQVRSRAKMLKRRTKEEMVFKKLFQDGLEIQKERIKELRRYAKEQREIQSQQRQNDIDSLENYYRDQFEMLADSVARERQEQTTREKAQSKILDQMKKELRKKMEREIEDFQDQLFRDDDDVYFRQLDADRLRQELRVAKYNVKV